jgi:ribose transport system substrate-binding protein
MFSRAHIRCGVGICALMVASQAFADGERIAYFASSAQNGYNQAVYEGIISKSHELGVEPTIFDGEFAADLQYSQVEDVLASGNFDGFVIMAQDTVGIAGAIEQITAAGHPIATVLFPIGPDLNSLEPQVTGLTASVIYPPADGAFAQAESVAAFCEAIDPCKVAIMVGFKAAPFDVLRLGVYHDVLGKHENIEIVAEVEGMYSPDASLTAMQDVLQAHPDLSAILSVADQQVIGAEIALESAGIDVASIFISGNGATSIGVEAVKAGRWDNTYLHLPRTMGELALTAVVDTLRGQPVDGKINMETVTTLPRLLTQESLAAAPDFQAEWQQ